MELKKGFKNIDLSKVQKLYDDSFHDSKGFSDLYFSKYKKYYDLWTLWEGDKLVLMTCLNKKRIIEKNTRKKVGIIVAVAVDKEHQGKGIMKNFMNSFIEEAKVIYDNIFIQAQIWNLYKSWNFNTCTKKYKTILKKDQYLKTNDIFEKVNYEKINEIYNKYVKINNYENFTYRTKKENKIILKMMESAGDKIIQSFDCYLIVSNNQVIDYAYVDFKNFMRLLSSLPFETIIWAHDILDKRFFKYLDEEKIETKILDKENYNILFSEFF